MNCSRWLPMNSGDRSVWSLVRFDCQRRAPPVAGCVDSAGFPAGWQVRELDDLGIVLHDMREVDEHEIVEFERPVVDELPVAIDVMNAGASVLVEEYLPSMAAM